MSEDALRLYRITHYLEMLKYEVEFTNKVNIDRSVWDKLNAIRNQANVLKLDIKRRTPDYNTIFEDLSNEKIFTMISVMYKMILMSETQCLDFEKSLEVEEIN
jgi:hypothetical protein